MLGLLQRGLTQVGGTFLAVGAIAVAIGGSAGPNAPSSLFLVVVVGACVALLGAVMFGAARVLRQLAPVPAAPEPRIPLEALARSSSRLGVSASRAHANGNLFLEPVLVVFHDRIYDRDGERKGVFRPAPGNPSLLRRIVWDTAPYTWELVDPDGRLLQSVREGHEAEAGSLPLGKRSSRTFKALAPDGEDMGLVALARGRRARTLIQVSGRIVGSLARTRHRSYSVRDELDNEVGRIVHEYHLLRFKRPVCVVVEMLDAMPIPLRQLMPAAVKAVVHVGSEGY